MEVKNRTVNFRIDNTTLEEFKKACGSKPYQTKIRELMALYTKRCNQESIIKKENTLEKDFKTDFDI